MGIRQAVLAVNKMNSAGYTQPVFEAVAEDCEAFAWELGIENVRAIPLSTSTGENVRVGGDAMPWYAGPTLTEALEGADPGREPARAPFRLPVQRLDRSDPDSPGFGGTIASERIGCGTAVSVFPSGVRTTVARIRGPSGDVRSAVAGQAVTLVQADEIGRGDVIADPNQPLAAADQFAAQSALAGQIRDAARTDLRYPDRHRDGDGSGHRPRPPGGRGHAEAPCSEDARTPRDRLLQIRTRPPGGV